MGIIAIKLEAVIHRRSVYRASSSTAAAAAAAACGTTQMP